MDNVFQIRASTLSELLNEPALSPPDGVTPDFTNPPNQNGLAWFVITACVAISTIAFAIRVYGRALSKGLVTLEELLIVLAYVALMGQCGASYALIFTPGYFVHQYNLLYKDVVRPSWLFLVFGNFYSLVLPAIKTAILLDWCRIFVVGNRTKNIFWLSCMAIVALQWIWGVACMILLNLQCIPHNKIWEFYLPGKCISLHTIQLCSASIQLFSDLAMTLLPHKVVWSLQMTWRKKLGVSLVFGCGALACISAGFRLYVTTRFGLEADQMYYFGPVAFWCNAEGACGLIIACVPCIPRLFKTDLGFRILRALGFKTLSHPSGNYLDPTSNISKRGITTARAYFEIDESHSMTNMKSSESTEQLRGDESGPLPKITCCEGQTGVLVTRTTKISVS